MKELSIKLNKKYYNIFKHLTDKQTGELVKGICAYAYEDKSFITRDDYLKGLFMYIKRDIDISRQNSANGKRAAAVLVEKKRNADGMMNGIGVILGKIIAEEKGAAGGE